ncbi:hypothetical protein ABT180_37990, partial [Streptomyces sp. NPDC001657]
MPDEAQPLSPGLRPAGSHAARPDEPKPATGASPDAPGPERHGATPEGTGGSGTAALAADRPRRDADRDITDQHHHGDGDGQRLPGLV